MFDVKLRYIENVKTEWTSKNKIFLKVIDFLQTTFRRSIYLKN